MNIEFIRNKTPIYLFFFLFVLTLFAQNPLYKDANQEAWVNQKYETLSLDERIGQLFMVNAYSNRGKEHEDRIIRLIEEEKIGGITFMQDDALNQIKLINRYQALAKIPLLISIDGEWGLQMRLKNTYKFPWAMTLGALTDNTLIERMAAQIAKQCKRVGVHFNFAPVIDVNINPKNPVIGSRSFGSNPKKVAEKGIAYMKGLQSEFVIASAKHFPGHGDTQTDSHLGFTEVKRNRAQIEAVELYPFRELIKQNTTAIMVGHLSVKALDPTGIASTSSKKMVTDLLRNTYKYEGIIVTDALDMKGAKNKEDKPGDLDLRAFLAGNDILLFSEAVKAAKKKILDAYNAGTITKERLEKSVKRILRAKYWAGLDNFKQISTENLYKDLNDDPKNEVIHREILASAMTVVQNKQNILPIKDLSNKKIAYVPLINSRAGVNAKTFPVYLNKYAKVTTVSVGSTSEVSKLDDFDLVIVGMHNTDSSPFGKSPYHVQHYNKIIAEAISQKKKSILTLFASPYGLMNFNVTNFAGILVAYQNSDQAQSIAPQILFGALGAKGKLPVDADQFKEGFGINTNPIGCLGYTVPEAEGMDGNKLDTEISQILEKAITDGATPGAQVLVARNGKVVYEKEFGHNIPKGQVVKSSNLYDFASISKVISTLPIMMQLYDQNKYKLETPLKNILPNLDLGNKANIPIKDLLLHQAGLADWIGFYRRTLLKEEPKLNPDEISATLGLVNEISPLWMLFAKGITKETNTEKLIQTYANDLSSKVNQSPRNQAVAWVKNTPELKGWKAVYYKTFEYPVKGLNPEVYASKKQKPYTKQVADGIFIDESYRDVMKQTIIASNLSNRRYRYSDLGYYLMQFFIENHYKKSISNVISENIYKPMGVQAMYNPLEKYEKQDVIPTVIDDYFRNQLIQGYVHDEGAAMMGGVAGHAGIFGNANDLAKIMQMYLQGGYYGGKNYINKSTLDLFTKRDSEFNRRGLGFDKPRDEQSGGGPVCKDCGVSPRSYGHTGFTGTIAWVDPDKNLVYVFLSNRVYPTAENRKLITNNVRTDIQEKIYQSIYRK